MGRVRSIQRFLREAEAGGAGQCLALNVPDFSKRLPVRGQVVAPPGYVIPAQNGLLRRIACIHSAEETRDELDAMVDCGCTVVDVIVEHPVYGQLTAPLHLSSRLDVDQFMREEQARWRPVIERAGLKPD